MPTFQRPPLELAEIVRRHGHRIDADLSGQQRRILRDIASWRTADKVLYVLRPSALPAKKENRPQMNAD